MNPLGQKGAKIVYYRKQANYIRKLLTRVLIAHKLNKGKRNEYNLVKVPQNSNHAYRLDDTDGNIMGKCH